MAKIHHYGYTEFYVDLTQWLKYDEENKLKIVVVEAVDTEGDRVPYNCSKVTAKTSEGLLLVGFGTGDPVTEENFTTDTCTLYEGRALMVLKKVTEDEVKVTVSDGKITAELQL